MGGTVVGLVGTGLMLNDYIYNDDFAVKANGPFVGNTSFGATDFHYNLFVDVDPTAPAQYCAVANGSGVSHNANVTDVIVTCSAFAFLLNAGDDTVSGYSVDATSGALKAVGNSAATGIDPRSIAATADKQFVYVVNYGDSDISAYHIDPASGVLTSVVGSPFGAEAGAQGLAADPRGAGRPYGPFLYVANRTLNQLTVYAIDGRSGALAPLSPAGYPTGSGPISIAVDFRGRFLFVANNDGSNDISAFAIDPATGTLSAVAGSPFAVGANPHNLALTVDGRYLYSSNPDAVHPSVSAFAVDQATGALTPLDGSPLALPAGTDIATDQTGSFLYLANGANVYGYRIDVATGALTALPGFPLAAATHVSAMSIDPTNRFMYVTDDSSGKVWGFVLAGDTGALTPMSQSPFAAGHSPASIATL